MHYQSRQTTRLTDIHMFFTVNICYKRHRLLEITWTVYPPRRWAAPHVIDILLCCYLHVARSQFFCYTLDAEKALFSYTQLFTVPFLLSPVRVGVSLRMIPANSLVFSHSQLVPLLFPSCSFSLLRCTEPQRRPRRWHSV